jgi:hypothetical protein
MDATRAKLIFVIELSGCLGPGAQGLCKVMAEVGGEGPEGLKSIYESLSSVSKSELFVRGFRFGSGRGEKSRLGKELSQEAGR